MSLFLIRHASSGTRNNSDPYDYERNLDALGYDQAQAIANQLKDQNISQIFSSRATRCVETVTPLADKLGIEIQLVDELFEGSSTSKAIEFVRGLTGSDFVACSHGDIIPDLIRLLAMSGTRTSKGGCAKGSIWQVENNDDSFATATYYDPTSVLSSKELLI